MLNRPPRHRADAQPIYIDVGDPAWDWTRIEADRKAMTEARQDVDRHPVNVYFRGASRYDLDARYPVCGELKSASDYVKLGEAWKFLLRRLPAKAFYRVRTLWQQSPEEGAFEAFRLGVLEVDGPEAPKLKRTAEGLTDEAVDEIFTLKDGPEIIPRIGAAVHWASRPLDDDEGKP
jgi:hypothetical protein